jgi:hypothetical protein
MGQPEQPTDRPFGERCLELLGYAHYIDQEVSFTDASGEVKTVLAQNFTDVCGKHAIPPLQTLEALSKQTPKHPSYDKFLQASRSMLEARLGLTLETTSE